jgi:hypothetical protein
VLLVATVR